MAQEIGDNSLIETWASTGNVIEPPLAKQNGGWEFEEQPPHEYMNWIHNTLGKQINYLMRSGVPAWNAATSYLTGNVVIDAGALWIALVPNLNSQPAAGNTNWVGIDPSDLETTTQLNARDAANRDRANHTGTQAISTIDGLQSALDNRALISAGVPSGAVQAFARETLPAGWLKADGSAVSRALFPDLFAAVGTTFGAGDGTSTFNLPDLRGEFIRGWDDGRGVDGGRSFGTFQADQNKAHTHSFWGTTNVDGAHTHSLNTQGLGITGASFIVNTPEGGLHSGSGKISSGTTENGAHSHTFSGTTASEGGLQARPRNVALLYGIKI